MLTMCHTVVFNLAGQTCYRRTAEGCGSIPICAILCLGKGHCSRCSEKPGGVEACPGTCTAKPHSNHIRVPGVISQVRSHPLLNNDSPSRAELACCHPSVSALISPGQPCPEFTHCSQSQRRCASGWPPLSHPTSPPARAHNRIPAHTSHASTTGLCQWHHHAKSFHWGNSQCKYQKPSCINWGMVYSTQPVVLSLGLSSQFHSWDCRWDYSTAFWGFMCLTPNYTMHCWRYPLILNATG